MNPTFDSTELIEAIDRFSDVKLLVIGDVMMDEFIWGTVERISPEAPVPVVNVTDETRVLGGAANVVNNIVSIGGEALLTGVVGQDRMGRKILNMLEGLGSNPDGVFIDETRPTIIKTRIVAQAQQVVRFDREKKHSLKSEMTDDILSYLNKKADSLDGVIISDYGKGVVSMKLMDGVRQCLEGRDVIITVDPQINHFLFYRNVTSITPNHHEAEAGVGMKIDSDESLEQAGRMLMDGLDLGSALVTRGSQGMILFEKNISSVRIPPVARDVFDLSGAGDTVIAVFTLGLAAGLACREAAILSNFAAGIVVGKVGTAFVTTDELKTAVLSAQ
ncbi:MAG: D-glycero-beta-D-manno-heptose-7-phosphate kinase [Deltaproteobacteria bacterium]|nr:D-glycero-beta-D-manno-heptose-7-phosphate kinase [Deltaproteobacteria bacterium]MBW2050709.1 D-glycero-beta-D-manno-heptose-7-phosphate kinase [Deltaproteobacteria bacterium]MBW2139772.1 D-glycero-beta-D-manno-heptose-7-phosphate kinase [Deltaproteobacteria bacterium]MBW2322787.1 D-glycero-beta-D-manno-heptose-7-phosphate kinase [Deltaproteobacteria bacterium]